jgi:alpha-tubulin suppressor-like RCC1 family protein
VTQIALGGYHTCALINTGGMKCWGGSDVGQIGDGSPGALRWTPAPVFGLGSGVIQITAGGRHTCALLSTGGVKCWGNNNSGQIGDGTSGTNRPTPVAVSGLDSGVTQIAAGSSYTCALLDTGGVKCWGQNDIGQVGDGSSGTNRLTPVAVSDLSSGVTQITAANQHTCALLSTGGVKCWGTNYYGQIGDGTSLTYRLTPVAVSGLSSGVTQITAGYNHTCALLSTGGVKCWGGNSYGQIGDGTSGTNRLTPVSVSELNSGVTQIAARGWNTCALLSTGATKCWGWNEYGQIGDGTLGSNRLSPVGVLDLSAGTTQIEAGESHTCALLSTGGMKCWGNNSSGQIGDGDVSDRLIPVQVLGGP